MLSAAEGCCALLHTAHAQLIQVRAFIIQPKDLLRKSRNLIADNYILSKSNPLQLACASETVTAKKHLLALTIGTGFLLVSGTGNCSRQPIHSKHRSLNVYETLTLHRHVARREYTSTAYRQLKGHNYQ
jgi:4-diphosphocytidyl-2C-methyl-D-erythritol kinase